MDSCVNRMPVKHPLTQSSKSHCKAIKSMSGGYDIIGDIHGQSDAFLATMDRCAPRGRSRREALCTVSRGQRLRSGAESRNSPGV